MAAFSASTHVKQKKMEPGVVLMPVTYLIDYKVYTAQGRRMHTFSAVQKCMKRHEVASMQTHSNIAKCSERHVFYNPQRGVQSVIHILSMRYC